MLVGSAPFDENVVSNFRPSARTANSEIELLPAFTAKSSLPLSESATDPCEPRLAPVPSPRFALAELNSLLSSFTAGELRDAIAAPLPAGLSSFLGNYIAAMVESACARRAVAVPTWTRSIAPLAEPVFGSELQSLRLHLLTSSPPAFRCRNIFIDATVGDQV